MRKTKEDLLITKEQILDGAFRCFSERGYDWTTIDKVAKAIGMSRGTVYWHYSDKKALYRAVVDYALQHADMAAYARQLPWNMPLEKCIDCIFLLTIHDNKYVDFYYKAIAFAVDKEEFKDTLAKLEIAKQELRDFFLQKCRRHMEEYGTGAEKPEYYADSLFLLLEGMFMIKNLRISVDLSSECIQKYVHSAIADLLPKNGG
jgi:AcrR family transcriptional regulator